MNPSELKRLTDCGERAAEAGRTLICDYSHQPFSIEVKGDGSPVTSADKAVENRMRELITAEYPDHGILGRRARHMRPKANLCG